METYAIKVTPTNTNFRPHIWTSGYVGTNDELAKKYAKQLTKMRVSQKVKLYSIVEVVNKAKTIKL